AYKDKYFFFNFIKQRFIIIFEKNWHYKVIDLAKDLVPGFRKAYHKFEERVVLDQLSKRPIVTVEGMSVSVEEKSERSTLDSLFKKDWEVYSKTLLAILLK